MTTGATRPPSVDGDADPTVSLLVDHAENRQLLERWFGEEGFAVDVPAAGGAVPDGVDLCVVDPRGYECHADRLDALKAGSAAFLPYLLVADDRRALGDPAVWDRVDDALVAPVVPAELSGRVSALLDRRGTSRTLARNGRRFRALFRATPDAVFALDGDDGVVDVNAAFCRTFDTDRDACVGRQFGAADALPEGVAADLRTAIAAGEEGRTVTFADADGDRRVAELAVASDGDHLVAVLRDVTERDANHRELERQNERLDEFASVLSHDLRNPLNVAEGWIQEADADEPWHDQVTGAPAEMRRLIEELLTLSRHGDVVGDRREMALAPVVDSAWETVDTGDATLVLPGVGPLLSADPDRLLDALANLFRNAVEHGSPGDGADLTVTVGWLDDDAGFVVADDGVGVPEDQWETVFDTGHTTADEGTGFGLAIVRRIVEAHGWTIRLRESEHGGARFEVRR